MAIKCNETEASIIYSSPQCNLDPNCDPFALAIVPATTVCNEDLENSVYVKGLYPPNYTPPEIEEEVAVATNPNEISGIESWMATNKNIFIEKTTNNILTVSDTGKLIQYVKEKVGEGSRVWTLINKSAQWIPTSSPLAASTINGYPVIMGTYFVSTGGLTREATNLLDYSNGFTFFIVMNNFQISNPGTLFGAFNPSTGKANWRLKTSSSNFIILGDSGDIDFQLEIFPDGNVANGVSTPAKVITEARSSTTVYLLIARYNGKKAELWLDGGSPETVESEIYPEPLVNLSYATDYAGVSQASILTPEWIFYNRNLSDVELNSIVLYLNEKYDVDFPEFTS